MIVNRFTLAESIQNPNVRIDGERGKSASVAHSHDSSLDVVLARYQKARLSSLMFILARAGIMETGSNFLGL